MWQQCWRRWCHLLQLATIISIVLYDICWLASLLDPNSGWFICHWLRRMVFAECHKARSLAVIRSKIRLHSSEGLLATVTAWAKEGEENCKSRMGRGMLRLADVGYERSGSLQVRSYKSWPSTKSHKLVSTKVNVFNLSFQTKNLQKVYLLEYELFSPIHFQHSKSRNIYVLYNIRWEFLDVTYGQNIQQSRTTSSCVLVI
jgi:hypothetical protein